MKSFVESQCLRAGSVLRLFVLCITAACLCACQSPEVRVTESLPVKKLSVNGTEMAFVEDGKGETIVFIHGAAGDWRSWEGLRPYIAQKYHFVSLSRRYHWPNTSSGDGSDYSVLQHADDAAAFIRALNVGKVHLVGGSYGGRIAAYVAQRHPELLRSVTMSDPGFTVPDTAEGKAARSDFQKDMAKSSAAARAGDARQSTILMFDAVQGDPTAFEKASPQVQQRLLDNAGTMPLWFAGAVPPPMACELLGAFKVPALVMRGERSRVAFAASDEAILRCLPKGTASAVVPNAAHYWYPVNPQAGAQAILDFVAKH